MKKILFIISHYLPGYRSGGPLQTIKNITEVFGDVCEIYILTLNHDMGSNSAYENVSMGWNRVGKAYVMYLPDKEFSMKKIVEVSRDFDVVYACSLFAKHTVLSLIANRIGKIKAKLVVAPMGVFSEGALEQKKLKKKIFLKIFKKMGFFEKLTWSVSSNVEKAEMEKSIGVLNDYIVAEDLPRRITDNIKPHKKDKGKLRVIFLSRICEKKNLLFCIKILNKEWDGQIVFDIYGTREDRVYWTQCKDEMSKINSTVTCNYCGEIGWQDVVSTFAQYDVFLFPTKGENFGHVIFEALSSGCIPIISDRTIWDDLNKRGCGEVIDLDDIVGFQNAANVYLQMESHEFEKTSNNAICYAKAKYENSVSNSGYNKLFL